MLTIAAVPPLVTYFLSLPAPAAMLEKFAR